MTDGGGYDPKKRSAPTQSDAAPTQSYSAPAVSAPAAAPMASAPASRWEPCTLPSRSHYLSLLLAFSFSPSLCQSVAFVIYPYAHTHALQMAEDMIRNGAVHQRSLMLRLCSRLPRFQRLSRRPCPAFLPPSGSLVRFPPPLTRSLSLPLCSLFSVSFGWLACLLALLRTLPVRSCALSHTLCVFDVLLHAR